MAQILDIPIELGLVTKESGEELKSIQDYHARTSILASSICVDASLAPYYRGANILLFDDVYRSDATLEVITDKIYEAGILSVSALTLTKTQTNI